MDVEALAGVEVRAGSGDVVASEVRASSGDEAAAVVQAAYWMAVAVAAACRAEVVPAQQPEHCRQRGDGGGMDDEAGGGDAVEPQTNLWKVRQMQ